MAFTYFPEGLFERFYPQQPTPIVMSYHSRQDLIDKLLAQGCQSDDQASEASSSNSSGLPLENRGNLTGRVWADGETMIEEHLHEVYDKLPNLEKQIWGKLIVMENNRRTAKAYLRHPVITIDGTEAEFDGLRVGLSYFENIERSPAVIEIHNDLEQGVKLKIDPDGNLWAKRMCHTPVFLKPLYRNRANDLFVVDQRPVKVFDIRRFKEILVQELKQNTPDRRRLEKCCLVCLKFSVDHYDLLRTPCWVLLVHLVAIELLNLVLPKDNDISSPSSSFIAPSPPLLAPSQQSPQSNNRGLNGGVSRARVGGVSKRIQRNLDGGIAAQMGKMPASALPQPQMSNAASLVGTGVTHCLTPNGNDWSHAMFDPALRGGGPPMNVPHRQFHYNPQRNSVATASMLDLRQINKYMSPPYFDRSNPLRTSRGGLGHQRFYEQQQQEMQQQQVSSGRHNVNELMAARTHMHRWKSQDSGIGSGSTGFNSFDSNK